MSANDSISAEQFGKHTIARDPLQSRAITATSPTGRNMGYLMWDKPMPDRPAAQAGLIDGSRPTISSVRVHPSLRGKGLASALLSHALKHEPGLQHDAALTPDGKKFAARHPL